MKKLRVHTAEGETCLICRKRAKISREFFCVERNFLMDADILVWEVACCGFAVHPSNWLIVCSCSVQSFTLRLSCCPCLFSLPNVMLSAMMPVDSRVCLNNRYIWDISDTNYIVGYVHTVTFFSVFDFYPSIFFYCCTVHFDNNKIPFTNKCTLLLNT